VEASAIGSGDQRAPMVFVIDDDDSVREALQGLLSSVGLRSTGFKTAQEFLESGDRDFGAHASCLIVDVRMPGIGGLDLQNHLVQRRRVPPIIFMSAFGDIAMTVRAMKAGARDFLPKPFRDQEMLDAVISALQYDQQMRVIDESRENLQQRYRSLSDRERALLKMLGDGLMNKQIASMLSVSEITVKVGRRSVMKKMKAHSFAQLVKMENLIKELDSEKISTQYEVRPKEAAYRYELDLKRSLHD
jgi:FixJ family two-component response regulator